MTMVLVTQPNPNIPTTNSSVPQTTNPSTPQGGGGSNPLNFPGPNIPNPLDLLKRVQDLENELGKLKDVPSEVSSIKDDLGKLKDMLGNIAGGVGKAGDLFDLIKTILGKIWGEVTDLQFWKSSGLIIVGVIVAALGTMFFMWGVGGSSQKATTFVQSRRGGKEDSEAGEAGEAEEAAVVA